MSSSVKSYGCFGSKPALGGPLGGLPANAWTTDMVSVPGGRPAIQHVVVDFTIGGVGPRGREYLVGAAVCVRGAALVSSCRATIGTIVDDKSGLEWQIAPSVKALDWNGALAHCNNLVATGQSDWRLPSTKELLSFFVAPCAAAMPLATKLYWSSTPVAVDPGEGEVIKKCQHPPQREPGTPRQGRRRNRLHGGIQQDPVDLIV